MLRDKTLTLQKAENMCKAAEAAAQQNAAWATERMQVDYSRRYERGKEQKGRCKHCGRVHAPWQCPAYGKTCYACKKKNHFSSCCKNPQVHGIQEDHEDSFDVLDVSICGISTKPGKDWIVRGRVSGHEIELKVDTGSQANLIPLSIFQRISKVNALRQSAAVLTAYNGSEIKHLGVATKALSWVAQYTSISSRPRAKRCTLCTKETRCEYWTTTGHIRQECFKKWLPGPISWRQRMEGF